MSGTAGRPDETRYYAVEQLREAQKRLLDLCQSLVIWRGRVEKYRNTDLAAARDTFSVLQTVRTNLAEKLGEIQLLLMEAEEYQRAQTAGKLRDGLKGFNLMSSNYRPVYDTLRGFAENLPVEGTTNAAIIGRLMNNIKLGYYPTDPENISLMLRGIQFPEGVITNLFDPCCGCGKALQQFQIGAQRSGSDLERSRSGMSELPALAGSEGYGTCGDEAQGNHCYAYGVELDESRAEEAQTRLHRVGFGSFFYSRISREAFHLLFLNPPYLSVLNQSGGKSRHEKRFLIESIPTLAYGGLLVYVIPYYRLTPDICRVLADNFDDLTVWRFTSSEFKKFKQAAVFGIRKRRDMEPQDTLWLERYAENPASIPELTDLPEQRYALPGEPLEVPVFQGEKFNQKELEQQLRRCNSFEQMMTRSELDDGTKRPPLPLSISQIGLVGGSGMISGLIECDSPHIIKGRIVKVVRTETEDRFNYKGDHMGAEIHETIANKMIFNILTPKGFKALT